MYQKTDKQANAILSTSTLKHFLKWECWGNFGDIWEIFKIDIEVLPGVCFENIVRGIKIRWINFKMHKMKLDQKTIYFDI